MRNCCTEGLELQLLVLLALSTCDALDNSLKLLLVEISRWCDWNAIFIFFHLVTILSVHVLLQFIVIVLDDHLRSSPLALTAIICLLIVAIVSFFHGIPFHLVTILALVLRLLLHLIQTVFLHRVSYFS